MFQKNTQILKEISQLIFSVENSGIQKTDKLKIIKVLLAIKLKLIEFLGKEIKTAARAMYRISVAKGDVAINSGDSFKISDKHELIIQFIKNNSGRVSAAKLLGLGIAGRTLRRYIRDLSNKNKIRVEKSGRNYFYTLT